MSTPVHVIPDELVLAAIERAERHRTNDAPGVPMWAIAAEEIERFGRSLRKTLDLAVSLLDSDRPAHSDTWFDLAEQLHRCAWQIGSATHCLHEWTEPDDARADIDSRQEPGDDKLSADNRARRRWWRIGRRNTWQWGWL